MLYAQKQTPKALKFPEMKDSCNISPEHTSSVLGND